MFYRVTVEYDTIVEAGSLEAAERKWLTAPDRYPPLRRLLLDQTVPCDKDGEEIEAAEIEEET